MTDQFHALEVINIHKPIKDAITITLRWPQELHNTFLYQPGQHLVCRFTLNGEEVRRSYSLNTSPFVDENLQITVKKVKGGLVSNYVNDYLNIGDTIEVMPPQGHFFADIQGDAYKTYFLFAAGSGITPIMSILTSVLHESPSSMVYLLYGNSNQDTIIFRDELAAYEQQYPDQLKVVHTLSDAKVWTVWEQWKGGKGRIDSAKIEQFITDHPPIAQDTAYFICGPGQMNLTIQKTLLELGVPKSLIHLELFGAITEESSLSIDAVNNAKVTASLNGEQYKVVIPKGETILEGLKKAGTQPPYSCQSGVCGACAAKVTKGKVAMKACMALDDKDIADGWVLTCQGQPTTEEVELKFE